MVKLVIFDFDGLLVDSQPLQYRAYNYIYTQYGYPLTLEDWHKWVHGSYNSVSWNEEHKIPIDGEKIRAEKKIYYSDLIQNELELKPGASYLINLLSGNFDLVVASASSVQTIKIVLEKFNLAHFFKAFFSDRDLKNKKPHPEIFLHLADQMRVGINECLVIEDSLAGLKAAKAAGMKCMVCPDLFCPLPVSKFLEADLIVSSLNEINLDMLHQL